MKKRIFIAHDWDGYPEEGWSPWLKKELRAKEFEIYIPQLLEGGSPRIHNWVLKLAEEVSAADENTYFVGHSMGCQTIARHLEILPEGVKVGSAVFVAGFFKRLTGFENDPDVRETDKHWLGTSLDLEEVKSHLPKSATIFSDNDLYVSLNNQDDFRDKLGSEIIIKHKMRHFSRSNDVNGLPVAFKSVLKIAH